MGAALPLARGEKYVHVINPPVETRSQTLLPLEWLVSNSKPTTKLKTLLVM
jgi:hypothetical protein